MQLVSIKDEYVLELAKYESKILRPHIEERKFKRPHIGIIIKSAKYNYFIPLSSPKKKDFDKNKVKKDCLNIIHLIDKNDFFGKISLNNMIPVPESEIEIIEIKKSDNPEIQMYNNLLKKQYKCIKSKYNKIVKNAEILYNKKINENNNEYWKNEMDKPLYLKNTVDFCLLEKVCDNWTRTHN